MSKKNILTEALAKPERELLFKRANEVYAAMKKNPQEWKEYQEELALWDVTLEDGL